MENRREKNQDTMIEKDKGTNEEERKECKKQMKPKQNVSFSCLRTHSHADTQADTFFSNHVFYHQQQQQRPHYFHRGSRSRQ
jgi:hypothetical protein